MSRSAAIAFVALGIASCPAGVAAQESDAGNIPPFDPEALIATQRAEVRAGAQLACPPDSADEIVVCARRAPSSQSPRVPFYRPDPNRPAAGEISGGIAAMNNDACHRLCNGSVGLNLRQMRDAVNGMVTAIRRLRDDE